MIKISLRQVLASVLALVSLCVACSLAFSAPINCSLANDDVEKTICSRPSLIAQDKAISDKLAALELACPSLRMLLSQGQKYWLRERSDCRNVKGVFEKAEGLATCLASRMGHRLQRLNEAPENCDPQTLAGGYRFVDPVHLLRFGDQYIGQTVSVYGRLDLDSCRASSAGSRSGGIVENNERFRVIFDAMPEVKREWLCGRSPSSHWEGIVKKDQQGIYLFLNVSLN